jgi:hypothetical protein
VAGETGDLKVPIKVPVETNADEAAASVEALRDKIYEGEASVRELSGSLRRLRGNSNEVKEAKDQLKNKINALRDSVSASNLTLIKQGANYDVLAVKTRKVAEEQKKLADKMKADEMTKAKERASLMGNALKTAGGPALALKERLDALRTVATGAGGKMRLLALAGLGLVAALAAVATAAVAVTLGVGRMVLGFANAERSLNLVREASTSSAQNAKNLGTQVDALARKVPTAKDAINDLGAELARSRLSGQAMVDTLNAVSQASAAVGEGAGSKLKDILTRNQRMQRIQLNPLELDGTGLHFNDIAESLSKSMGVSMKAAQAALFEGRVKLDDGAKAIRMAVEKRFGEINARKMLDLNVMALKAKEGLQSLTRDIKFEPMVKAVGSLFSVLSEATVTGVALKKLITVFGDGLVKVIIAGVPFVKRFFQGLIIGGLESYITFLKLKKTFKETFGDRELFKNVDWLKTAFEGARFAVGMFAMGLVTLSAVAYGVAAAADLVWTGWNKLVEGLKAARDWFTKADWTGVGTAIVEGLVKGLMPGAPVNAIKTMASAMKKAFTGEWSIRSPSGVSKQYGKHIAKGAEQGVDEGAPGATRAMQRMIAPPSLPASGGGGRSSSGAVNVTVTLNILPGVAPETAQAMKDPSILAQIAQAIEQVFIAQGVPVR